MKRVAIFGNAGGGKSALARELAAITGLPLHVIDKIRFRPGGSELPREEYLQIHTTLLSHDEWIIDGFDNIKSAWERFEAADTLVHVDLPLMVHAWWVTKRLVKGLFISPEGWPENSPVILSSISSYRVLWPCYTRQLRPNPPIDVESASPPITTRSLGRTKSRDGPMRAFSLRKHCRAQR
jgi:adenylate kinase family enzyme